MKLFCFIVVAFLVAGSNSGILRNTGENSDGSNYSGNTEENSYDDNQGRKKRDVDKVLKTEQVSTNCRTVVAINVNSPIVCSKITLGNLLSFNAVFSPHWGHESSGPDQVVPIEANDDINMFEKSKLDLGQMPGKCRFDPYRAKMDPNSACLCVATQDTCTKGRDGCYWHDNKETGYSECISKAEKFYNQLYTLLKRRGKKSFAINIRYGATPARGSLPYGPWGPAIIGQGNPQPSQRVGLFKDSYGGGGPKPPPKNYGPPKSYGPPPSHKSPPYSPPAYDRSPPYSPPQNNYQPPPQNNYQPPPQNNFQPPQTNYQPQQQYNPIQPQQQQQFMQPQQQLQIGAPQQQYMPGQQQQVGVPQVGQLTPEQFPQQGQYPGNGGGQSMFSPLATDSFDMNTYDPSQHNQQQGQQQQQQGFGSAAMGGGMGGMGGMGMGGGMSMVGGMGMGGDMGGGMMGGGMSDIGGIGTGGIGGAMGGSMGGAMGGMGVGGMGGGMDYPAGMMGKRKKREEERKKRSADKKKRSVDKKKRSTKKKRGAD